MPHNINRRKHLCSGSIWIANFYLLVFQMIQYSDAWYHGTGHINSRPIFKWWSEYGPLTKCWPEYQTTMVPSIWIVKHSMGKQISMNWIPNYFAIQIPNVLEKCTISQNLRNLAKKSKQQKNHKKNKICVEFSKPLCGCPGCPGC